MIESEIRASTLPTRGVILPIGSVIEIPLPISTDSSRAARAELAAAGCQSICRRNGYRYMGLTNEHSRALCSCDNSYQEKVRLLIASAICLLRTVFALRQTDSSLF